MRTKPSELDADWRPERLNFSSIGLVVGSTGLVVGTNGLVVGTQMAGDVPCLNARIRTAKFDEGSFPFSTRI